jgi:outer membrane protein assembly factor BamD
VRVTRLAVLFFIGSFIVSGCGLFESRQVRRGTPEALYQMGYENYHEGNYEKAIEAFQRVQELYPLSKLALLAEMGIADSYFSNGDYAEAEMSYEDFMNLHPTNDNIPYVMYQIAMCHYNQMSSIDRDQSETQRARQSFERLISRFPDSKFAFMAEKQLMNCKKLLAEHEFYVGHFYFKRGKYKSALRRFEYVAREYAGVGLDYRLNYFIKETKERIDEEATEGKTDDGKS